MLNGAAHLNYAVYSSGTTVWDDNLGAVSYTSLLNLGSVVVLPAWCHIQRPICGARRL